MKKSSKIILGSTLLLVIIMAMVAGAAWGQENTSTASAFTPQDVSVFTDYTNLPLLSNNYVFVSRPNAFGLQMPGNTGAANPHYEYMAGSGASWIRVPFQWKIIEPVLHNPAQYNWNSADTFTQAARPSQGGLKFIVTLGGNPDWASSLLNGPLYDPVGINAYAAFVGAAVERYDGDGIDDAPGSPVVNYWEIYNEPDRGRYDSERRWGYDGDKYAELLEVLYPVVKAANPNAQLVFGGIAYDYFQNSDGSGGPFVRQFLDDVLAAGGGDFFDIMNFHFYPAYWWNWTSPQSPGLLEKANFIKDKLAFYGFPNKPHLITEAGWHSNYHPVIPSDEETQARYVVELFTQAFAAGSEAMVWWQLHDPLDAWIWMNGLTTLGDHSVPPDPKPSYTAFQTAVNELGTADFHRILSDAETGSSSLEVYEFHDSIRSRTVFVAWTDPIHTTLLRPLRLPAPVAVVRNMYNVSHAVFDGDDGTVDGYVTVGVNGSPVYIEIDS